MSTASADRPGESRLSPLRSLALGAACLVALAGCSDPLTDDPPPAPAEAAPTALASATPVPADLLATFGRVLDARSAALQQGDLDAFRRGVARRATFRTVQETYFANLAQLPLATVSYEVDPGSLLRRGDDYWVTVDVALQLEGYDVAPVETVDRYRFSPSRRDPSQFVVSSVTDRTWEELREVRSQPWDLGPIQVREGAGVLGIFDETSVDDAGPLLRSVEQGISDVSARVPHPWDGTVVVYALSDPTFLATLDDVPGGEPEVLDGLTFPVPSAPGSTTIASTRFILSPGMVARPGAQRDRLVRHELTHVALGELDDHAPLWLSEGIAEYVSVQPLAPEDRRIEREAVQQAEAGVEGLPADETFNDDASGVHYGLAWWACEYVAGTYGEAMLWSLLEQFAVPADGPADRVRTTLGIGPRQLAHRSARLMIRTFDPEFLRPVPPPVTPSPSGTPSGAPSGAPSAAPSAGSSGTPAYAPG
jgi:hypothetical protein